MNNTRIENLRSKLGQFGIDGILVFQPENRRYLSGFTGSTGYVLITATEAIFATDFRYVEQAGNETPGFRVVRVDGPVKAWFPGLVSEARVSRLGVEAGHVNLADFERFKSSLDAAGLTVELVPVADAVESLRLVKDAAEIKGVEAAARLTCEALARVSEEFLRPGVSEKKLAWELEKYIRESGAELSFPTIVAGGPASAMSHAQPTDRLLQENEPIVIDMGAKLRGYCGDLTRTYWLGAMNPQFVKIYNVVLRAQKTAIEGIASGMIGAEADRLARDVIVAAGYGDNFGHSLGHGIGLEIHENPRLGPNSTDELSDGMIFTVEPGIYITGWGGIRIEDDAVLENGKIRLLTSSPK